MIAVVVIADQIAAIEIGIVAEAVEDGMIAAVESVEAAAAVDVAHTRVADPNHQRVCRQNFRPLRLNWRPTLRTIHPGAI
jgi:hypothetical protein